MLDDKTRHLSAAEQFHCMSHQHMQCGFWSKLQELGLSSKLRMHWAAPIVFQQLARSEFGNNSRFMSLITAKNYKENGYGGWHIWDNLLTGVKIAVFTILGRPSALHLFGMNFYTDGFGKCWDMHGIGFNLAVLEEVMALGRQKGIEIINFKN